MDADDWIETDYIEQLMALQSESKAQIVAVAHYHDIGNTSVKVKNGIKNSDTYKAKGYSVDNASMIGKLRGSTTIY